MIIKIVMLLMSWTLATGTPEGKLYHYVKIKPPGATTYKTVGALTYAASLPSGVVDPGTDGVFVAWVHKSEAGTVIKPKLAAMLPTTTTITLIDLTIPDVTAGKQVLDITPGVTRVEDNFRVCFTVDATRCACWVLMHDAEGQWRWEGYTAREFREYRTFLPLIRGTP